MPNTCNKAYPENFECDSVMYTDVAAIQDRASFLLATVTDGCALVVDPTTVTDGGVLVVDPAQTSRDAKGVVVVVVVVVCTNLTRSLVAVELIGPGLRPCL